MSLVSQVIEAQEANGALTHLSGQAKATFRQAEWGPLFLADWTGVVFIHYAVPPAALQPFVPFELDLRDGLAYVSLVAFTMSRMRPGALDSRLGERLMSPLSPCRFLNARTYVRHRSMEGIYFLAEWLSSAHAVPLGPPLYGLPYRYGELDYRTLRDGTTRGRVASPAGGVLAFSGNPPAESELGIAERGSLTEFLLERYVAFTRYGAVSRYFRVWHEPWRHAEIGLEITRASLLSDLGDWSREARLVGAAYSPGARNVWMGRPRFTVSPR